MSALHLLFIMEKRHICCLICSSVFPEHQQTRFAVGGDRVVVVVPGQRGRDLSAPTAHTHGDVGHEKTSLGLRRSELVIWLKQDQPEWKGK